MKKLVFILGLASAFAASAGTIDWSIWDDSSNASTDYIMYLMAGSLADGAKITDITDASTAKTYVSSAVGSGVLDHTDGLYAVGSTGALDSGSQNFYALLFNNSSIDSASDYLVVGSFTVNVPGSGAADLSMDVTGRTSSGWSSISGSTPTPGPSGIPEPTSGLLLLVGGAMLALRRKQK